LRTKQVHIDSPLHPQGALATPDPASRGKPPWLN